jgi:allantoin racemase
LRSALAPIEQSLLTAGLWSRCAGVRASDLDVLDLEDDPDHTAIALIAQGRILLDGGADVLVLGCAGMGGLDERIQQELGVPVIDGVAAAVNLCEVLVGLGKTTSSWGPYASPSATKSRPGWPVSLPRPVLT